jgi:hypothetical protein
MLQQLGLVAARVFESVGEYGEAVGLKGASRQDALVVGGAGKSDNGCRLPGGAGRDGTERVAEDVTQQLSLDTPLAIEPFLNRPADYTGGAEGRTSTGDK